MTLKMKSKIRSTQLCTDNSSLHNQRRRCSNRLDSYRIWYQRRTARVVVRNKKMTVTSKLKKRLRSLREISNFKMAIVLTLIRVTARNRKIYKTMRTKMMRKMKDLTLEKKMKSMLIWILTAIIWMLTEIIWET